MTDDIKWTAHEIADLLSENLDKIIVFNQWRVKFKRNNVYKK